MRIFIFTIVTLFVFRPILPIIGFIVNHEYIVAELCENKNAPEENCKGTCYLKKELAQTAQENNPLSDSKKFITFPLEVLFINHSESYLITNNFLPKLRENLSNLYKNLYSYQLVQLIFHPPLI